MSAHPLPHPSDEVREHDPASAVAVIASALVLVVLLVGVGALLGSVVDLIGWTFATR